jgi:hypothetical protein
MQELVKRAEINIVNADYEKLIEQLAESQINANKAIAGIAVKVKDINMKVDSVEDRVTHVEKILDKRVYLDAVEKKELTKHVRDKVKSYLAPGTLEYKKASRYLYNAIWGELKNRYNVMSYDFLPSKYFDEIVEYVDKWQITPSLQERINKVLEI